MPVRPYQPADREQTLALFDEQPGAIDSMGHHVLVYEQPIGRVQGAALWFDFGGAVAELVTVTVPLNTVANRVVAYGLALAAGRDMQAHGFTRGQVRVRLAAIIARLRLDLTFTERVAGYTDGEPSEWVCEFDIEDALMQLQARGAS